MSLQSSTVLTMPSEKDLHHWQAKFEGIDQYAFSQNTFVVLDLETSGSSPAAGAGITEIGAVKVRGGEITGQFQTLVNPEREIPSYITALTGISSPMLATAPKIEEVLPTFLEFLGSHHESILVAHNAPFDLGFLKAEASRLAYSWPSYRVLDTARLAREVLHREEVANVKLATLAQFFNTHTAPSHRALDDVLATVDVLHALLARVELQGITSYDQLKKLWKKN